MDRRPSTATLLSLRLSTGWVVALALLGLALRLPGLLVNGMLDLDEILLTWGAEVSHYGLAAAFRINYGLFSYAFYGPLFDLGVQMPRFWWAPYKLTEIAFEAGIAAALYVLLPPRLRWAALLLYWLNPWFILHGAYQGFWEGPHLLMALLAVLALRDLRDPRWAWLAVGALLMSSAMFKPQGMAYFVVPVGLYLVVQLLRFRSLALGWFVAGGAAIVALGTLWVVLLGGKVTAIADNYLSAGTVMANLCNGCVGIWRTIAVALQMRLSQGGPTYLLRLPAWFNRPVQLAAGVISVGLILLLTVRLPLMDGAPQPWGWLGRLVEAVRRVSDRVLGEYGKALAPWQTLLVVMAFASLVVAQLGTRAHINHTYTTLVLLIPLVVLRWPTLVAWLVMVVIQFYAHLSTYQLGRAVVAPQILTSPEAAQPLVDRITAVLAAQPDDTLLHLQQRLNDLISGHLPQEPVLALLSIVHFACAVYLILVLLRRPRLASPRLEVAG